MSTGTSPNKLWRHGIEIKATILPTDFAELLTIERKIVESRKYSDQTLLDRIVNCPDTSGLDILDTDPQSNGSTGVVYDFDAAGINMSENNTAGTILRRRTNFKQWVSVFQLNGVDAEAVRVSSDISWYQRLSISKNVGLGTSIINDVSNDNNINANATSLTWNLGNSTAILPNPIACPN